MHIRIVQSFPVAPKMCRPWEQIGRAECDTQCVKRSKHSQICVSKHTRYGGWKVEGEEPVNRKKRPGRFYLPGEGHVRLKTVAISSR